MRLSNLPRAQIPIGHATVNGKSVPVYIDQEWMRSLSQILSASDKGVELGAQALANSMVTAQESAAAADGEPFVVLPGKDGKDGVTTFIHIQSDPIEPELFVIPGAPGAPGGGGSLSSASIAFTNGDTVQRVTVVDASVSDTSKIMASIRRPDQADASAEKGYVFTPNIVRVEPGTFDVQVVCLGFSGEDVTEDPPNETVSLIYSVSA